MILMQRTNHAIRMLLPGWLCAVLVYGQASQLQTAPAALTVSGDIPSSLILKAEDLAKMPRETVTIPDQDGTKVDYEGVPLREILKRAGAPMEKELRGNALASYVLARAHDGYQVVFTLAEVAPEFANELILVAPTSATASHCLDIRVPSGSCVQTTKPAVSPRLMGFSITTPREAGR